MITNFAIFKNNKKTKPESPDYNVSAKIGEQYETIGSAWVKEGTNGKFFSISLKKPYKDIQGYKIEPYTEAEIYKEEVGTPPTGTGNAPSIDPVNGSDSSQIPF